MTEYFEVVERDGPARLGTVRLASPQSTPALCDSFLRTGESQWSGEPALPDPSEELITMLPSRGFPPGTDDRVIDAFDTDPPAFAGPSGTVITEQTARDRGVDVYALSTAQSIVGHAAAFCETITAVRGAIPPDTALYLSGVATPANAALLCFAGVDLLDDTRARILGSQGVYLTRDGRWPLAEVTERPCPCRACRGTTDISDRDRCIEHNVNVLTAELATIRERIRQGSLREYVSAQVRHDPWQTAAFRRLHHDDDYLLRHEPVYRHRGFNATTDDDLFHPAVQRFSERVTSRYRTHFRSPLVLLPCSATKPYSDSQSHKQFQGAIEYRAHRVSLSSPVGVVPQELECTYPAQHYDVPVTGEWSETERSVVGSSLNAFLDRNEYPRIIAHVAPGPYRELVAAVADTIDCPLVFTVEDHPTTEQSLQALDNALTGELKYSRFDRRKNTILAIADYQFGAGAGQELFGDATFEAPWPKHRVRTGSGELLASMVPEYGLLALTIAGAKRWEESPIPTKYVEIDDFVPHGDVLAPGIRSADETILVGDEVVVTGPSAYAVGRAQMNGVELAASTRGVGVDLRHSEER